MPEWCRLHGGPTPWPGVRIEGTIHCLPCQTPPPCGSLLFSGEVGVPTWRNPTSFQAGGCPPAASTGGHEKYWPGRPVTKRTYRVLAFTGAGACCWSRGGWERACQPQPWKGSQSLKETSWPMGHRPSYSQPRPCLASPGSWAQTDYSVSLEGSSPLL